MKNNTRIGNVLKQDEDKQHLVPKICDECYGLLLQSLVDAEQHDMVAVHCPHYMVLMEVELVKGVPLGVIMSGPITAEEANAKLSDDIAADGGSAKPLPPH